MSLSKSVQVLLAAGALTGCAIVLIRWRCRGTYCVCDGRLDGKTVVVTGANSGIGKATTIELCRRGAKVVMACRDVTKGTVAAADIRRLIPSARLSLQRLDLSSFSSIVNFARLVESGEDSVDVLINNAGVYQCPLRKTVNDLEYQIGVNFFGPFLLTELLLGSLKASAPSRIVSITSSLARYGDIHFENLNAELMYDRRMAYQNSKLALNLWMQDLSERLAGSDIGVYCVTPGMVDTDLGRYMSLNPWLYPIVRLFAWLFLKTPESGAQTVVHCAVSNDVETGRYYRNCNAEPWPENTENLGIANRLRAIAFETVKDYLPQGST